MEYERKKARPYTIKSFGAHFPPINFEMLYAGMHIRYMTMLTNIKIVFCSAVVPGSAGPGSGTGELAGQGAEAAVRTIPSGVSVVPGVLCMLCWACCSEID